eukprot:TRINITY_DN6503_c0_g2_i1.p1 TRINITY_DN6503_c0_g2~~TRINITY_DN6503_c0_g2_i1.p1  ORF type:complete len:372 (+),score=30.53 TRINITY_DN6503_c0_g2_i1:97-1212(+)
MKRRSDLPTDEVLQSMMESSFRVMAETQRVDGDDEVCLAKWLRWIRPPEYLPSTRIMAAEWFLFYHQQALNSGERAVFDDTYASLKYDMEKAWELIDIEGDVAMARMVHAVIPLHIALLLKDYRKMESSYEILMSREVELSDEEVRLCFMCAPYLGRWAETVRLATRILANSSDALLEYHKTAHEPPYHVFDYEVLYYLARERVANGIDFVPSEFWKRQQYQIISFRLRLKDVMCDGDEEKTRKIKQDLDPTGQRPWQVVQQRDHSRTISCYGALAKTHSFSTHALPLVGPADPNRIKLLGYSVLDHTVDSHGHGEILRQTESYDIMRNAHPADVWTGVYSLYQDKLSAQLQPLSSLHITFDMEIVLREKR